MNVTIDRSRLIPSVLPLRLATPFSPLLLVEFIHLHFSLCGIIPASRAWVFTSDLAPRHPHLTTILRSTNLRIISQTSNVKITSVGPTSSIQSSLLSLGGLEGGREHNIALP
jgi:hypothetical protein